MSVTSNLSSPLNKSENQGSNSGSLKPAVNTAIKRVQKLAPLTITTPGSSGLASFDSASFGSASSASLSTTFSTPSTLSTTSFTTPSSTSTDSPFYTPSVNHASSLPLSIEEEMDVLTIRTPKTPDVIGPTDKENSEPVVRMVVGRMDPTKKPKFSLGMMSSGGENNNQANASSQMKQDKKPKFTGFVSEPSPQALSIKSKFLGITCADPESDNEQDTTADRPETEFKIPHTPQAISHKTFPKPPLSQAALPTPKGQTLVTQTRSLQTELKRIGPRRGVYKASQNQTMVFVKPFDEVRGGKFCLDKTAVQDKEGVRPEMAPYNELIAKRLSPSSLPQTLALDHVASPAFNLPGMKMNESATKMCLIIEGIQAKSPNELDKDLQQAAIARISHRSFLEMAVLDLRLVNPDRNLGNVLISEKSPETVIPIDHATILPAGFASDCSFTWMNWDQSHLPFDQQSLATIASLNVKADQQTILEICPTYPQENLDIMESSYHLLKLGAQKGLTPFQLGLFYAGDDQFSRSLLNTMFEKATKAHASLNSPNKPSVSALMNLCITDAVELLVEHPHMTRNQETWNETNLKAWVGAFFQKHLNNSN